MNDGQINCHITYILSVLKESSFFRIQRHCIGNENKNNNLQSL